MCAGPAARFSPMSWCPCGFLAHGAGCMHDCPVQYASIDVADMMGTNRQGITKNILMRRIDQRGNYITNVDYTCVVCCCAAMIAAAALYSMQVDLTCPLPRPHIPAHPARVRSGDQVLEYEEVSGDIEHDCRVTMYNDAGFQGWEVPVPPGRFTVGDLEKEGGER